MTEPRLSDDGATLTVWNLMTFRTKGGRKLVASPDGVPYWAGSRSGVDDILVKALARTFRWRRLLETTGGQRSRPKHVRTLTQPTSMKCHRDAW